MWPERTFRARTHSTETLRPSLSGIPLRLWRSWGWWSPLLQSVGIPVAGWKLIPAAAVVLSVVASAVLTFATLWTRDFHLNPKLNDFAGFLEDQAYAGWNNDRWMRWVGKAICKAYYHNEAVIEKKAILIRWNQLVTLALLIASLTLVAVAVTTSSSGSLPESVSQD